MWTSDNLGASGSQGCVGRAFAVVTRRCLDIRWGILERQGTIHLQAFPMEAFIERVGVRITDGLSGPGKVQGHLIAHRPNDPGRSRPTWARGRSESRSARYAPCSDRPPQKGPGPLGALVDLYRWVFTSEIIGHRYCPKTGGRQTRAQ